jgi:hypothetical protein
MRKRAHPPEKGDDVATYFLPERFSIAFMSFSPVERKDCNGSIFLNSVYHKIPTQIMDLALLLF